MKESKYNIEFGHLYSDQLPGPEQVSSFKELKSSIHGIKDKESIVTSVLFDDYSPSQTKTLPDQYLVFLGKYGVTPDFFVLESLLPEVFPKLSKFFSPKDVRSAYRFLNKTNKLPCALLVATWNILRLGVAPLQVDKVWAVNTRHPFASRFAVSILPKKYESVELRALKYISNSKLNFLLPRILHKYY